MSTTASRAEFYGLDSGALPSDLASPVSVINFFELREQALYGDEPAAASGLEAMLRYSAISAKRLAAVGGTFATQGLSPAALWGVDQDWDLVVVANYPSGQALLDLLDDSEYQEAYHHRRAAVSRQRVTICATLPETGR